MHLKNRPRSTVTLLSSTWHWQQQQICSQLIYRSELIWYDIEHIQHTFYNKLGKCETFFFGSCYVCLLPRLRKDFLKSWLFFKTRLSTPTATDFPIINLTPTLASMHLKTVPAMHIDKTSNWRAGSNNWVKIYIVSNS